MEMKQKSILAGVQASKYVVMAMQRKEKSG
jgi:hypothetical protein